MKIGIITAMSSEQKQLAQQLQDITEEQVGAYHYIHGKIANGNTVVLTQCGIGKVNASVGATLLIEKFAPDCVISTGVAGGIDTCLKVMDVVASAQIVHHDVWCGEGNAYGQVQGFPLFFASSEKLLECAMQIDTKTAIHGGLICSGDKFITSKDELKEIKRQFPEGLAVDMESASIAQVCHIYKMPFISFRIISDTPGAEKHWDQYTNFWGEMAGRSFMVTKTFLEALPKQL